MTTIPRKMNNDESKLYASIIVAERQIAIYEGIKVAAEKRLGIK